MPYNFQALNNQHKAAVMSERLIGLDAGNTIIEYVSTINKKSSALNMFYHLCFSINLKNNENKIKGIFLQ